MPIVSGTAWEARRTEQAMWDMPPMPPTLAGGYVSGPIQGYFDPRLAAAAYASEPVLPTYVTDTMFLGPMPDQAAVFAGAAAVASARQRCPLRDISNVAARFSSGVKVSKAASSTARPVLTTSGSYAVPPPPTTMLAAHSAAMLEVAQAEVDGNEEASEYVPSIFNNLFAKELLAMATVNYMEAQVEVNPKMRGILIDWLVDVQAKYRMRSHTLFLTVNLIDRYLSKAKATRRRLQLVGVVAMFIAAKFEELEAPQADSLVYITDNAYTKREIFDMECNFLAVLGFNVLVPTAQQFLDRLQQANSRDGFHRDLAQYILELGLPEYSMIGKEPSRLAAAAVLLSNRLMGVRPVWSPLMAQTSRWSAEALEGCAREFQALLDDAPHHSLQAVRKKFSEAKRSAVAKTAFRSI